MVKKGLQKTPNEIEKAYATQTTEPDSTSSIDQDFRESDFKESNFPDYGKETMFLVAVKTLEGENDTTEEDKIMESFLNWGRHGSILPRGGFNFEPIDAGSEGDDPPCDEEGTRDACFRICINALNTVPGNPRIMETLEKWEIGHLIMVCVQDDILPSVNPEDDSLVEHRRIAMYNAKTKKRASAVSWDMPWGHIDHTLNVDRLEKKDGKYTVEDVSRVNSEDPVPRNFYGIMNDLFLRVWGGGRFRSLCPCQRRVNSSCHESAA